MIFVCTDYRESTYKVFGNEKDLTLYSNIQQIGNEEVHATQTFEIQRAQQQIQPLQSYTNFQRVRLRIVHKKITKGILRLESKKN